MSFLSASGIRELAKKSANYLLAQAANLKSSNYSTPNGDGWSLSIDNKSTGFKVWSRMRALDQKETGAPDPEIPEICAHGVIKCKPESFLALLKDTERRHEWDAASGTFEIVEEIDKEPELVVTRTQTKSMMWGLIASREYLSYRCIAEQGGPTNMVSIVGDTLEREEFPITEGAVRGWAINSGYVVQEVEGNTDKTSWTYCATTSAGGSIPYYVLLKGLVSAADDTYKGLRKALEK